MPIDLSLLPTEVDIETYETRGWYVSPPIFNDSLLDAARSAVERHHTGMRDYSLPSNADFADWRPGDGEGVRNNEFFSLQNEGIRPLARHPIIGAIAARLSRTSEIRLFDDQAVCKPPGGPSDETVVGWHTDHSYWSTCTSESMLTAWIPLQDTKASSGTLVVLDGSHRWPESENVRDFNNPDLHDLGIRLGRSIPEDALIPLELKRGQVSFHHMRLLHASGPNRSPQDRIAIAVHLQDSVNRYRSFRSQGKPIVLPHDRICRQLPNGDPDYSDPAAFPVLWREAEVE